MTVSHSSQLQGWQVCTGVLGKRNLQPIALHYPALHLTGQGGKGYQLYAELPGPTYPQVGLCLGSVHPQPCVGLGSHTHSCAWARGLGCAPSGGTLRQRRICHTHSDPVGRNSLQRLQWGRDRLRDFKPTCTLSGHNHEQVSQLPKIREGARKAQQSSVHGQSAVWTSKA